MQRLINLNVGKEWENMALIKCKSCGEKISDKSTKCVHCGYETKFSIVYICPECKQKFNNIVCKNCGYRNVTETEKDANTSRAGIGISLGSLFSGIVMGAILGPMGYGLGSLMFMGKGPIPIIFAVVGGVFGFFYGIALIENPDAQEILDDHAMFNASPKERAMYNQLKRNGKNKK